MEETLFSSPFSFVLEENRNFLFLSVSSLSLSLSTPSVYYTLLSQLSAFLKTSRFPPFLRQPRPTETPVHAL